MLVKVVLSYYMEGEHSQGAKALLGCQSEGLLLGGATGDHELAFGETGQPLTLRKRGRAGPRFPSRAGVFRCALKACGPEVGCPMGVKGKSCGVLGPPGYPGVDSASARTLCPRMPLGDGRPSLDRAVDAPAWQDVPAWDGNRGLAL